MGIPHKVVHRILGGAGTDKWSKNMRSPVALLGAKHHYSTGRKICSACNGLGYHPKKEGERFDWQCNICGGRGVELSEDEKRTIINR